MAYRIARSLLALLVAYLLAGLAFVVIHEIRYDWRPVTALFADGWKEVLCYLSDRQTCCRWSSNCPLTQTVITACFAAVLTLVPALVTMWVVRRFRWYRPLSEILTGGALGLLAAILATQIPYSDVPEFGGDVYPSLEPLPYVVPGMIGGLSYWLIAGRPKPPV